MPKGSVLQQMGRLMEAFATESTDRSILEQLLAIIKDRSRWPSAKGVFDQIRSKARQAAKANDQVLDAQYRFEEACAKTIYNFSGSGAPFDEESPYWVVPAALIAESQGAVPTGTVLRILVEQKIVTSPAPRTTED